MSGANEGQLNRLVMRCDNCCTPGRPAKLVMQEVVGPYCFGEVPPFVFRYRLCQWCLAAENRRAKKDGRPKRIMLAYKPDSEVWAEHNKENTRKDG